MTKKILMVILCVLVLITGTTVTAETPAIKVFVDASEVEFDVPPVIEEGRTLVPMRFIFEALGAEIT